MILDQYGKQFNHDKALQTQKTEDLAKVAMRAPEHPVSGLTPAKAAALMKEAEDGNLTAQADLAQDMQAKSAHLYSEIAKRRRAVTSLDWTLTPPPNASPAEEKDTQMLEELVRNSQWVNDVVFNATDAILKGYSCQEIEWDTEGALVVPKTIHFRNQGMFKTTVTARNTLVINDGTEAGLAMNPFGWITHIAPSMSGYLSEISLARVLVWPFIFASYPMRDLLEFLEIYGLPLRLGKYNAGATPEEKNTLLRAVMTIGHNAGGIIPRGMEIEFEDAANGQTSQFLDVVAYAEKSMSKAILGGTLTSQSDGATSTNALGNIHDLARLEIRNSDVAQLEPTLSRDLIYPLWALNAKSFGDPKRAPKFSFDTSEPEDVTVYATALPALVGLGLKISKKWAHEKLQIPLADENEEILTAPAQNQAMLKNQIAALKAENPHPNPLPRGEGAYGTDPQNILDQCVDQITNAQYQKTIDPLLEPIVTAILKSGLDEARNLIPEIYENMDRSAMTEMLTRAIFVADVWGRTSDE